MKHASLVVLGLSVGWSAPALAQTAGQGVRPDPFQCLAKSPLTDALCGLAPAEGQDGEIPAITFVSINQYGELTSDFDNDDDVRDFTAEAMFSDSLIAGPLTDSQLRAIARVKPQWESYNRASFRAFGAGAVDVSFKHRELEDAQIIIFANPTAFNDITVDEYGIGFRYGDFSKERPYSLRAAYRHSTRAGLIEFLPDAEDEVDEVQLEAGFRTGQTFYSATLVHQEIDLQIPNPYDRGRDIVAGRIEHYTGGLQVFGGAAYDRETFGAVESRKTDIYAGAVQRSGSWDFGGQARLFTSELSTDPAQDNSQLRLEGMLRWRSSPGNDWPFALQFPVAYDSALEGLDAFENYRFGAEAVWRIGPTRNATGPAWLLSLRIDHQEYVNIDDSNDTFLARLAFGF